MHLHIKLAYISFLLILFTSVQSVKKCYNVAMQNPTISALLDLHFGENCDIINYYGLQQAAVLELAMKQINSDLKPTGIELVLQIFDTCSSKDGAQIAALKALVASKQTCMKTPLFIGFLGPENKHALDSVQDVSRLFKIPHIIPYSYESKKYDNVFNVAKYPIDQHTKMLEILLNKMNLQRIILLIEDNFLSKWKAETAIKMLNEKYCLSQPIIIKRGNIFQKINNFEEDYSAILAIIESPTLVEYILEDIDDLNTITLISVGRSGIINWPMYTKQNVYAVQMISSSPIQNLSKTYDPILWKEFSNQMNGTCHRNISNVQTVCEPMHQDWTLKLLNYGLQLFASNLQTAYNLKCNRKIGQGLCPKLKYISRMEWNLLLNKASLILNETKILNKLIKFNMNINVTFTILSKMEDILIEVGEYKNEELIINENYFEEFENLNKTLNCEPFKKQPLPTVINKTHKISQYNENIFILDMFKLKELGYIQMIGVICGIGFGITIILTFIFYNIYKGFHIATNNSSTWSSRSEARSK